MWLAFFLWIPLFIGLDGLHPRAAFKLGWLSGGLTNAVGFVWLVDTIVLFSNMPSVVGWGVLFLFGLWQGIQWAIWAGWLAYTNSERSPAWPLQAGLVFAALEWGFPQLFPYAMGATQFRNLPLIQLSSVTGVAGVTALLITVNATLYDDLSRLRNHLPWRWQRDLALLSVGVAILGWGHHRVEELHQHLAEATTFKVGLVQQNLSIAERRAMSFEANFELLEDVTAELVAKNKVDLVVWAEGASPYSPEGREPARLPAYARRLGVPLVAGAGSWRTMGGILKGLNTVYFFDKKGRQVDVYAKLIPLPFGEYIPFADTFPFLKTVIQGPGDFSAGVRPVVFRDPEKVLPPFSMLICYEAILSSLPWRFAGTELFLNVTNDAWFGDTAAPWQHFMLSAIRAVEHGIPLVRVANTGTSGVVDITGRIRGQTPVFQRTTTAEDVPRYTVPTVYHQLRDWFPTLGLAILLLTSVGRWRAGEATR